MIRRDSGNHWLLISQLAHARLAGELAEAWVSTDFPPVSRGDLLAAVLHHDDGWRDWELDPQLDVQTGRPRDFTEMPMGDSTAIWTRSIEQFGVGDPANLARGKSLNFLGRLWISRHFCALAEYARENRVGNPDDVAASERFLSEQQHWREFDSFQRQLAECGGTPEIVENGFQWLRFFDRISLWLCCAERSLCWTIASPRGKSITFTPVDHGRFALDPYPLSVPRLELTVSARMIHATPFANQAAFRDDYRGARETTLRWIFEPAHGKNG